MPSSPSLATVAAPERPRPAPAAPPAHGSHREDHHAHSPATSAPAVEIGVSVLRLSLAARLAIAGGLLALLWTAVALVAGTEP